MRLAVATVLHGTAPTLVRLWNGRVEREAADASDLDREIGSVVIDSRLAVRDDLFVALPGERTDGHRYVPDALLRGTHCLVDRLPPEAQLESLATEIERPVYLFHAPDALTALQSLATYWRRNMPARIIGITGSVGKTTTKEIVASVLGSRLPVFKSEANLNTEIGLPLMLLRLSPEHRVGVFEMGLHHQGDIALLARVAEPDIAIVTNIGPVHLERMGSIERIAREKSELVAALPPEGTAILNGDDPWTRAMALSSGVAPTILVGLSPACAMRAVDVAPRGIEGLSFTLVAGNDEVPVTTTIPGEHTIFALLAAAAAARVLGFSWDEARVGLERASLEGRQRILRMSDGLLIIDDCYNAAPISMQAALTLLSDAPGGRIAVLGDMLELGPEEEAAHRQVGRAAALAADWLVVRGPRSEWIAQGAKQAGLAAERVLHAAQNGDAVAAVHQILSRDRASEEVELRTMHEVAERSATAGVRWTVLVKGSRGMKMEEVVQALRGEG